MKRIVCIFIINLSFKHEKQKLTKEFRKPPKEKHDEKVKVRTTFNKENALKRQQCVIINLLILKQKLQN